MGKLNLIPTEIRLHTPFLHWCVDPLWIHRRSVRWNILTPSFRVSHCWIVVRSSFPSNLLSDSINRIFYYRYGAVSYHSGRIEGAGTIYVVVSLAMDSSSSFSSFFLMSLEITKTDWFSAHLGPHLMSVMKARAAAAKIYHTIDSVSHHDQWKAKSMVAGFQRRRGQCRRETRSHYRWNAHRVRWCLLYLPD